MSFPPAPVAHTNPFGAQVAAELSDRFDDRPRDRDPLHGLLQGGEFGLCDRLWRLPGLMIGEQLLQPGEPALTHVTDSHSQQETVEQRFQFSLLRQFIRGPAEGYQWSLRGMTPVLELALIHQPQQVVQDRKRSLEGLVEEG